MKDVKNIFRNLEKSIKRSKGFGDDWELYNRGTYIQLYKLNWYNQKQSGVHFETFIETPQLKQKLFPVCLHAEEDCPAQPLFIQEFLAVEGKRISSWKGYKIDGAGYNICQRVLPLNFKNLEQRLLEEFNRLRQLESSIDHILASLTD